MFTTKLYTASIILAFLLSFSGDAVSAEANFRDNGQTKLRSRDSCPNYYTFGIGNIDVVHHRSASEDTIYIAAIVAVGKQTYNITQYYGKHGNGNFDANIVFPDIYIPGNETAILTYLIVNNGHASQTTVENALINAAVSLAQRGVAVAAGIAVGEDVVETVLSVLGFGLSAVLGVLTLLGFGLAEIFTEGCDGWLAAGVHAFPGPLACLNASSLQGTDANEGVADEKVLGFIPGIVCSTTTSLYDVSWYAQPIDANDPSIASTSTQSVSSTVTPASGTFSSAASTTPARSSATQASAKMKSPFALFVTLTSIMIAGYIVAKV